MRLFFISVLCVLPYALLAKDDKAAKAFSSNAGLRFSENVGQVTDQNRHARNDIDFSLPGKGMSVFIGNGQLHYQFSKASPQIQEKGAAQRLPATTTDASTEFYRMDVTLVGANTNATIIKEEEQPAVFHYLLPQCNATAHTYSKITYRNVYPNIDWVLYVKDNQLEYDFVVHEGGDPAVIKLRYDGTTQITQVVNGDLSFATPMGSVTEHAPVSFTAKGEKINSSFNVNENIIGFKTGKYNGALTIDPSITWANYYGGSEEETISSVKNDSQGYIYISGSTTSGYDIATDGAFQSYFNSSGLTDGYLTKFDATGTLIWGTFLGGYFDDNISGIAFDDSDNIFVTGYTNSYSGITTNGSNQMNFAGAEDAFIARFNSNGERKWCTYYGGSGNDYAMAITTDHSGGVYIGGYTGSANGISTAGSYQQALNGASDGFIAKFTNTGSLTWGTYFGGSDIDKVLSLTTGNTGNLIAVGETFSNNNIAGSGAYQSTYAGGGDGFICSVDAAGAFQWSTYYGGSNLDYIACAGTDATGNLFIAGVTASDNMATPGAYQAALSGATYDGLLAKFSGNGALQWATYYGGPEYDYFTACTNDAGGNIIAVGYTASTSGIATTGAFQTGIGGYRDGFACKLSAGGSLLWGSYLGGTDNDDLSAVCVSPQNDVYIAGITNSYGLGVPNAAPNYYSGDADVILAKIADCTTPGQPGPITGNAFVCGGDTETYSINTVAGATSYQWIMPSGWIGSSTTNSITTVTNGAGGTITVIPVSACGGGAPQKLNIINLGTPAIISAYGSPVICPGSSTLLQPNIAYNTYAYQWKRDGINITSANTPTYNATQSGNYSLYVTDATGCTAASNDVLLNNGAYLNATVTASSDSLCIGNGNYSQLTIPLNIAENYQWLLNGVPIPNSNSFSWQATSVGNYSVILSAWSYCTNTTAPITITALSSPSVPIVTNNGPACTGTNVLLSASNVDTGTTYTWTGGNNFTATQQNATITNIQSQGYYSFTVTGANGCSSSAETYVQTAMAPLHAYLDFSDTVFCAGNTVIITGTTAADSYVWTLPQGWVGTSDSGSITAEIGNTGGLISISETNNCGTTISTSNAVVLPVPNITITQNGAVLSAPGNLYNYQWYLNGSPIQGANSSSYTCLQSGAYYVLATNTGSGGCAGQSNAIDIMLGIPNLSSNTSGIMLYPNPNTGTFTLSGTAPGFAGKATIELLDVTGRTIATEEAIVIDHTIKQQVSMDKDAADGMYLIRITSGAVRSTLPFMKR